MSVQATSKKRPHHNFVQQRLIANAPRESKSLALENEKGLERTRSCGSLPQCRTFPWKCCHHALVNGLVHCRFLQAMHCMRRVMCFKISWGRCRDTRAGVSLLSSTRVRVKSRSMSPRTSPIWTSQGLIFRCVCIFLFSSIVANYNYTL